MAATTDTRELVAELVVLEWFDYKRQAAGHDYGAGQRAGELARRRRELDELGVRRSVAGNDVPSDELRAAFERVGRPRLERILSEGYRSDTPATAAGGRRAHDTPREARGSSRPADAVGRPHATATATQHATASTRSPTASRSASRSSSGITASAARAPTNGAWTTAAGRQSRTGTRPTGTSRPRRGSSRVFTFGADELEPLQEDDYCHECGQIGCTADGR